MIESVVVALAVALYIAPALVAVLCGHPRKISIVLVTLLLGWTLVGWVACFIWACRPPREPSAELAVAKRMLVVEIEDLVRMKQRGQVTNAEYAKRRKTLIERYSG